MIIKNCLYFPVLGTDTHRHNTQNSWLIYWIYILENFFTLLRKSEAVGTAATIVRKTNKQKNKSSFPSILHPQSCPLFLKIELWSMYFIKTRFQKPKFFWSNVSSHLVYSKEKHFLCRQEGQMKIFFFFFQASFVIKEAAILAMSLIGKSPSLNESKINCKKLW